jgi:hypothetical protein
MSPIKTISLIAIIVILSAGIFYFVRHNQNNQPEQIACTMEAKICPDGSAVGRSGPNCEFAACPTASVEVPAVNDDENWITSTTGQGVTFQYPENFSTIYTHPPYYDTESWPPKITVSDNEFSCAETPAESSLPDRVARRIINGKTYCVSAMSEGAAGSVYTTYIYTVAINNRLISASFTLQAVQCYNYDDPQKSACVYERETFDLDAVADKIIESVKI